MMRDHLVAQVPRRVSADPAPNEAYCIANPGKEYAVYFPNGGEITVDLRPLKGSATLTWLDIMKSQWADPGRIEGDAHRTLRCPAQGHWAVLIQR